MSETHVNAHRLELAEKEAAMAVLKGEVDSLKKKIASLDPTPDEVKSDRPKEETAPAEEATPTKPVEIEVKDGDVTETESKK